MAFVRHSYVNHATLDPYWTPYKSHSTIYPLVLAIQLSPSRPDAPTYIDMYQGQIYRQDISLSRYLQYQAQHGPATAMPIPPQWQGAFKGFGVRDPNDKVPFSLWDPVRQDFRRPTTKEYIHLLKKTKSTSVKFTDYLLVLETSNPPKPTPKTLGGMPVIFILPGQDRFKKMIGSAPYDTILVKDPCFRFMWGKMRNPSILQMMAVLSILMKIVNVERVNFLPSSIIVELVHGDGRVYERNSLPGIVANLPTTYHHNGLSYFNTSRVPARDPL